MTDETLQRRIDDLFDRMKDKADFLDSERATDMIFLARVRLTGGRPGDKLWGIMVSALSAIAADRDRLLREQEGLRLITEGLKLLLDKDV